MSEVGRVVSIDGLDVEVEIIRKEACSGCHGCDIGKKEFMNIKAVNLCEATIGDKVKIDLGNKDFLGATFVLYGIPLILLVMGFVGGYYLGDVINLNKDLTGFVAGIVLLLLAYKWIKSKEELWKSKNFKARAFEIC